MLRKILWILLVIVAGVGLLLCVADLIGVWVVKVQSLIAAASAEAASIEQVVSQWDSQITAIAANITRVSDAAPRLIDVTSVVLSLLFVLFGAGQVSLLLRAIAAVRRPA